MNRWMRAGLVIVVLFAVLVISFVVITPRVTRFDPIKIVRDGVTGYGANSERHKNARQLPTPWDPVGDANRRVEAIPMEDRAYPLIAEAAAMLEAADVGKVLFASPGDTEWEEAQRWFRSEEAQAIIELLLQAAAKPEAGILLSDRPIREWEDARARHGLTPAPIDSSDQVIEVLIVELPVISRARHRVHLLRRDAGRLIAEGDGRAAIDRLCAAIDLQRHRSGFDMLIEQLVRYQCVAMVFEELESILANHPGSIDPAGAVQIEASLQRLVRSDAFQLRTSGDALMLEDQIRRLIDERGVFGPGGALTTINQVGQAVGLPPSSVERASINADLLASLDEFERWAQRAVDSTEIPYEPMEDHASAIQAWSSQPDSIPGTMGRLMFGTLSPSWTSAVKEQRVISQRMTALRLALAAHRHRLRHGDPPLGLADIDDDLITFDPIDGFTGGPMQFRWRDGAPLVYTYGPDKDDDGGRHVLNEDGEPWESISDELLESAPDGDFVLFPTPSD